MTAASGDAAIIALTAGLAKPVAVLGEGALGDRLRDALASPAMGTTSRPATVVETTGSGAGLEAALALVGDLGTVVLAGPVAAEAMTLDLYTDLHVRGLTLVGLPVEEVG